MCKTLLKGKKLNYEDLKEAMATDQPDTTSTVRTSTSYRSTAL